MEYQNELYDIRMNEFCAQYLKPVKENVDVSRPKCSISPIDTSDALSCSSNAAELSSFGQSASTVSPFVNRLTAMYHQPQQYQGHHNYSLMTSSPYLAPRVLNSKQQTGNYLNANAAGTGLLKPIQFQSTPNKSNLSSYNGSMSENFLAPSVSTIKTTTTTTTRTTTTTTSTVLSRVNFHSIHELAKSSSGQEDESKLDAVPLVALDYSSGYGSQIQSFNEHLSAFSQSLNDKENHNDEADSLIKVRLSFNIFCSNHIHNIYCLPFKTKRKPRTQINKQQKEILEYAYKMRPYPDANEVEYLCQLLGFEENVIRVTFILSLSILIYTR